MGEEHGKQVRRRNNEMNGNCSVRARDYMCNNIITLTHYHSYTRSPLILKVNSQGLGVHTPVLHLRTEKTPQGHLSFYSKVQSNTGTNENTSV